MLTANVAAMLMLSDATPWRRRVTAARGTHRAADLARTYSAVSVSVTGAQWSPD